MKKLNNEGWSIPTMIALVCVLILFILVVSILSWRAGVSKSSPSNIYDEALPDTTESIIESNE
ncbi:MAG: hypothetical protein IJH18_04745 [Bacilli bacterium]|nr:hypothetical protein [Bacilli bacterium]MBQ3469336.1 hypothetical protein [Bacilli bacterium]